MEEISDLLTLLKEEENKCKILRQALFESKRKQELLKRQLTREEGVYETIAM